MSEVFIGFETADVFKHVEVSIGIDASSNKSLPMDALELDVGVILLELELHEESEVNVWALDGVLVLTGHDELVEIKHLWEDLHFFTIIKILIIIITINVLDLLNKRN